MTKYRVGKLRKTGLPIAKSDPHKPVQTRAKAVQGYGKLSKFINP
jgi:hypothetical protein